MNNWHDVYALNRRYRVKLTVFSSFYSSLSPSSIWTESEERTNLLCLSSWKHEIKRLISTVPSNAKCISFQNPKNFLKRSDSVTFFVFFKAKKVHVNKWNKSWDQILLWDYLPLLRCHSDFQRTQYYKWNSLLSKNKSWSQSNLIFSSSLLFKQSINCNTECHLSFVSTSVDLWECSSKPLAICLYEAQPLILIEEKEYLAHS